MKPLFEIDNTHGSVTLELGSGETWLTFKAEDIEGTARNCAISARALTRLHHHYVDGLAALLEAEGEGGKDYRGRIAMYGNRDDD